MSKSSVILFTAALALLFLPHPAPAQTAANISVVSGNGQLICDGCPLTALPFFDQLVVKVTGASGNPVPNAQVSWSVAPPTIITTGAAAAIGALSSGATTTTGSATGSSAVPCNVYNTSAAESSGYSCNAYVEAEAASVQIGPIATQVTASIPNGNSVTFYLTQSPPDVAGEIDTVFIQPQLSPSSIQQGVTISGPVNSAYSSGSISVVVRTFGGTPIPNVSLRLIPETANQGGASIACQTSGTDADPESVLTDSTGTANCVPVFGPTPGSTPENFEALVGGVTSLQNPSSVNSNNGGLGYPAGNAVFQPFRVTATAVTPGSITLVGGNNQTSLAGSAVTNPLIVVVKDTNGNPLSGVTVTWAASPSTAATLSPASGVTASNGQAQTTVTLASSASGTVTVTASVSGLTTTVPFTITATQPLPTVTGLSIPTNGGNNQSAQAGAPFALPLIVQVAPSTVGAGVTINFALGSTSVPGVLSALTATTTSNGQASIGVTAGATPGTLTVVASVAGATNVTPVTFTLAVTAPPPPISATSFLNGAGFFSTSGTQQTALSPCGVGTMVVGSTLSSSAFPATPNMYATPLGQTNGISIAFPSTTSATGTSSAPILNITTASTGQQLITFQVPCDVMPSSATVTVTINGANVTIPGVTVDPGAPGIFETISSDGVRRAVAVRANGSFVGPNNGAQPGEFVTIYVTGVGPTVPALATGVIPVAGVNVVPAAPGQVIVGLDSSGVGAVTVTASPELIGVYQVNFQVPANTSSGDHVLAVGVTAEGNPTQFQQPGGSKLYVQ